MSVSRVDISYTISLLLQKPIPFPIVLVFHHPKVNPSNNFLLLHTQTFLHFCLPLFLCIPDTALSFLLSQEDELNLPNYQHPLVWCSVADDSESMPTICNLYTRATLESVLRNSGAASPMIINHFTLVCFTDDYHSLGFCYRSFQSFPLIMRDNAMHIIGAILWVLPLHGNFAEKVGIPCVQCLSIANLNDFT